MWRRALAESARPAYTHGQETYIQECSAVSNKPTLFRTVHDKDSSPKACQTRILRQGCNKPRSGWGASRPTCFGPTQLLPRLKPGTPHDPPLCRPAFGVFSHMPGMDFLQVAREPCRLQAAEAESRRGRDACQQVSRTTSPGPLEAAEESRRRTTTAFANGRPGPCGHGC